MLVFDTESDGFVSQATKLHIIVTIDYTSGDISHYFDPSFPKTEKWKGTIEEGIKVLFSNKSICHNYIEHDLPLILKLYPESKKYLTDKEDIYLTDTGKIYDSLILSRMLFPNQARHSVEHWGNRFGVPKPGHEDWSKLSEDMITRCEQDTIIQHKLTKLLFKRMKNHDWTEAVKLEHNLSEICYEMCENRWKFDVTKANKLYNYFNNKISKLENIMSEIMPIVLSSEKKTYKSVFKKDGTYTKHIENWIEEESIPKEQWPVGPFSKLNYERLTPSSLGKVKQWLLKQGWEPSEWNFKKDKFNKPVRDDNRQLILTSPKLNEEDLEKLSQTSGLKAIRLLAKFYQLRHRRSLLKGDKGTGLLNNVDENGMIRHKIIPCGTNTSRSKHSIIVNIPSVDAFFGKQLRSLFIAHDNEVMVGWDAKALESRVEAHYSVPFDGGAYAHELLEGDIHQKNADVYGVTRSQAKPLKYGITYGCAPAKFAKMLNRPVEQGQELYDAFWEANQALKGLKHQLEVVFEKRKDFDPWIRGIDGRKQYVRYKHALINTLFQSGGSILVKKAFVLLAKKVKLDNMPVRFLGMYHDEVQASMPEEVAEDYGKLSNMYMQQAGEHFKTHIKMEADYKTGQSWLDTH